MGGAETRVGVVNPWNTVRANKDHLPCCSWKMVLLDNDGVGGCREKLGRVE